MADLFSSGGTTTTTQQWPVLTPEQLGLLQSLVGQVQAGIGRTTPYPGMMYVPLSPYESQYLDWASQIGQSRLGRIAQGEPAYTVSPEQTQEWFKKYEEPAYWRQWEERVKPVIQEQYAGPGYWGSDRARAVTRSAEDLAAQIAQAQGQRLYSDELARRQGLTDAYNRVLGATTAQGSIMSSGGALLRSVEEQKAMSDLQRWLAGEAIGGIDSPYSGPQVQLALALLGINPYAYQNIVNISSPGAGYGALQGIGSGIGSGIGKGIGDVLGDIGGDIIGGVVDVGGDILGGIGDFFGGLF